MNKTINQEQERLLRYFELLEDLAREGIREVERGENCGETLEAIYALGVALVNDLPIPALDAVEPGVGA